ncbi:anti-phage defense-associated sirtuin Dsr1 [Thalassobaculum salexigens]|uniref:anti-phage defense-associated sirtuin Dsr1 n=1 Tax=Thalassobaculum salexigens TaxID=455360 RepID=UPI00041B548C|nr:anti-phage defense-associated sirtuin Dsr1 [Thalassobaculum salexigens]
MQFTTNGPDIPDALLQAHEEGRVVFFCGAGISYPAGLPGFEGLVTEIYSLNGTTPTAIEQEALDRKQFDAALDLLERRLPGQRMAVRSKLAEVLEPKLRRKGAVDTHVALLRLARSREGSMRLVTTNFDRVFHAAARRTRQTLQTYAAPMLPIPKSSRWDGVVYLHGLLPQKPDETALNRLVITSGDFGLAYLTERWAARFVSELFRNYTVCFVGYSINDPVLRYMMDALAADRMLGEVTPEAWALGDCAPANQKQKTIEWEAKGVTPILYDVPAGTNNHSILHQTLQAWANTYRDGVQGKESIVVKHALARPQNSTQQDDYVGRMLWALSDKSGIPAKRFADFNPVPSLDWLLEAFSEDRFGHLDLVRFDVPPRDVVDDTLSFSLVNRPVPYDRAPPMVLAFGGIASSHWDDVMSHLARWLTRHLGDPRLILWIAQRGGQLHDRWAWFIEDALKQLTSLERDNKLSELDEIRSQAPNAIPSPFMRTLWNLLLSGRLKSPWHDPDLFRWNERLKLAGLSATLRLELRELISPKVALKKPFRWLDDNVEEDVGDQKDQLVDWELVLSADHVRSVIPDTDDEHWKSVFPHLLDDFQQLLRDALDLARELGGATDFRDRSFWDLPSISPHWQNRGFHDWVTLIELLRDAWLSVLTKDNERAIGIALAWFDFPYPTFKRLALFAASQESRIEPDRWVRWLLADGSWWLWAVETQREVYRLIVLRGGELSEDQQKRLESAILAGPPREMYLPDLAEDEWQDLVDRSVWLHLSKLNVSGLGLGALAEDRLRELSDANPKWQLAADERDEFSHWMSGTGDPDYEDSRDVDIAPRTRRDLVGWLAKPVPEGRVFYEDTWREVCRTRFFHSFFALCDLGQEGVWPVARWRQALQAWSEEGGVLRSWRHAAPLVQTMPDRELHEVAHAVTWWMESASKVTDRHDDVMLNLSGRVLAMPLDTATGITRNGQPIDQPVTEAINHPIGRTLLSLINMWFRQEPNDNDLLPDTIKPVFTSVCDPGVHRYRHGRVVLASRLIALFRVDRTWTEENILPFFKWNNPEEARSVWQGFLWSPRLYEPLLGALKLEFLECANHFDDLGEYGQQYSAFLTYAALGPVGDYTIEEFRSAFGSLPREGLEHAARALSQAIEGAADQREDYWRNRAKPFWQQIWPKSRDLATSSISESLVRLVLYTGDEFPSAVFEVKDWLQEISHLAFILKLLRDSGKGCSFPQETLLLLDLIIGEQGWIGRELGDCLDQMLRAEPVLEDDHRYHRLRELARRRRM